MVIDAGVGTEDNLKLIRQEDYNYISVSGSSPREIPAEGLTVIKDDKNSAVKAKTIE
ncbi:MAG: hypothetical protein AAGB97_08930 [Dehalococcoidia bacterium]